ncbi:uncharacterized protein LOC100897340 [Galendromus occidentalis]|uniref:Uncharacterized protein LOC100897340 n=1 Tax=Galendromus occidentalis TaxID=34638 RepID=A0AAJ6QRX6_9ACAR|nr:uncharacterized protein LOC100897340 [Galendromus occidentalis]
MLQLLSLIAVGWAAQASAASITCDVNAFDKASGDILLYGNGPRAANDRAQLEAKCLSEKKSLKFAENYADQCVNGLGKGMLKIFIEGAGNEINKHCSNGPMKDKYVRIAPCINEKAGGDLYKCNRLLAALLEGTLTHPKKKRVPLSCCSMNEYVTCVTKHASKCGKETADFAREIINTVAGDLLDTVCTKYKPNSKECRALPKVNPASAPKYKSLLPPLAEVLDSLGS